MPHPEHEDDLSGGEIALIVIGIILGVALIAYLVYRFVVKRPSEKRQDSGEPSSPTIEFSDKTKLVSAVKHDEESQPPLS